MMLAKELLEHGEREAVLAYFDEVKGLWASPLLEEWAEEIKRGEIPDFGANLFY
jgi:hypothetical protein